MMREFQLVAAVLILSGVVQSGIINKLTLETELNSYIDRVRIIYSLLAEECPDWRQHDIQKRNVMISSDHLDVEKRLYNELMDELILCRDKNRPRPTSTTPKTTVATTTPQTTTTTSTTTTTPTTTTTTTPAITTPTTTTTTTTPTITITTTTTTTTTPTTTTVPLPIECRIATNFTESWRLEHSRQNIRPGGEHSYDNYACDIHTKQWFRFSGQAGNRMLNTCPPHKSCGTYVPFWSDAAIPDQVGVRVEAQYYGSNYGNCKSETRNLTVVRCSDEPNDVVYFQHYPSRGNCQGAFCGMN